MIKKFVILIFTLTLISFTNKGVKILTYTKIGSHDAIAILPDGKTFIAASTGYLDLWGVESGEKIRTYTNKGSHDAIAILPDGKTFIAASTGYLDLWDVDKR
jgi:WD40 repeat protein